MTKLVSWLTFPACLWGGQAHWSERQRHRLHTVAPSIRKDSQNATKPSKSYTSPMKLYKLHPQTKDSHYYSRRAGRGGFHCSRTVWCQVRQRSQVPWNSVWRPCSRQGLCDRGFFLKRAFKLFKLKHIFFPGLKFIHRWVFIEWISLRLQHVWYFGLWDWLVTRRSAGWMNCRTACWWIWLRRLPSLAWGIRNDQLIGFV